MHNDDIFGIIGGMQIEKRNIADLRLDPKNARAHDRKNLDAIKGSLTHFGQQKPIVIDASGAVIAGNGTLTAATQLGWSTIDVVVTDLPDVKRRAFALADNKTAELATWFDDVLQEHLKELAVLEFPLGDIGFELPDEPKSGDIGDDDVPDTPENVHGVKLGDLWLLGKHRLLCGDCTVAENVERLMDGKKADMVFTDPPYGVDYDGGAKKREKLVNDHLATDIYDKALHMAVIATNDRAAFYIWYADGHMAAAAAAAAAAGIKVSSQIIWVKNNAQFMSNARYKGKHEPCMYGAKKTGADWFGPNNEVTVWECDRAHKNEYHPTQKPTYLSERAINNSAPKSGVVLDLFLGSGSTLIACEKTNRTCYGMEIDPHYCSVIIERWQQFTGQKAARAGV